MPEREIPYEHTVKAWTVGDLRRALDGIPDDTPLEISTLEDPSSSPRKPVLEADRQVVTSTGWEQIPDDPASAVYLLMCDFPSGDDYVHYEKGW